MTTKKPNTSTHRARADESIVVERDGPERKTKRALLLGLISKPGGTALAEITEATGWLPHTARAAITGLRKSGEVVRREKVGGISRYILGTMGK